MFVAHQLNFGSVPTCCVLLKYSVKKAFPGIRFEDRDSAAHGSVVAAAWALEHLTPQGPNHCHL